MMQNIFLFIFGGFAYGLIEILYKGSSHISMFIAGGLSFWLIGLLDEGKKNPPLIMQMILSGVIVTIIEFVTGIVVNLRMGLNVWNYVDIPFNIAGQVCLIFSIIWAFLSVLAIVADDYIRYWLFGRKKPEFHFF